MLIRSQSKEVLVNVDNLAGIGLEEAMATPVIVCCNSGCAYVLGKYSSRERAKKVLDMIQEAYTGCIAINSISAGLTANEQLSIDISENKEELTKMTEVIKRVNIFQMPEDREVEI